MAKYITIHCIYLIMVMLYSMDCQ